ncbi:SHOCT domain-containing protein [Leptolyngbya sp. 7M]|nr:SHOCT domain-containing protein [Leptolyngbya sp. 7M]
MRVTNPVAALIESDNIGHDLAGDTIMTKLADLKKLLDAGLITHQEYDSKKSELLSRF